ncbi:MAG: dehydrogenase [Anaerolineae bacterium]|nr:dehydrogenase [Anaerolineae bacterium]
MRILRVAFTGDYLNERGELASGDIGLGMIADVPNIQHHFITDLAPQPNDPGYWSRFYSLEVTPAHIRDIDMLVVLRPWIKPSTFAEGAGNLTVIARAGAGYDKIDVAACTANDVAVFNSPDSLTHSTATSALMFMLALVKRLPEQERLARTGRWDLQSQYVGRELRAHKLGIIGLGRSGRELVRLLAPFEMQIMAYSPQADPAQAAALGVELTSLERVMRESDIVSVHSNLTAAKHKMITAAHLAMMKPSAYFVNVARGELVDQDALVKILQERRIAGAALDVFEHEPLPVTDPLIALDNVILTPHWSPATRDVKNLTSEVIFGGMRKVARGDVPDNILNPDVLDRPNFRAKLARFAENA